MKSFIKDYENQYEDQLNLPMLSKELDRPLVEYIVDCFKSLEVLECLHFDRYEYTENISGIDINRHIYNRDKKKKKKDRYTIKMVNDTRNGKLTVYMTATILEADPITNKVAYQSYPIKKEILIPLADDRGRYFIKGKEYYLLYQMVEKSTYTGYQSVVLKSLMPLHIKRHSFTIEDIHGKSYTVPFYHVLLFNKEIPILLFYMSKGASYTLDFLNVSAVIRFVDAIPDVEECVRNLYFEISQSCYIEVDEAMFKSDTFIQSVVGGMIGISTNRVTLSSLEDSELWIKKLTNPPSYEKGSRVLAQFARLLDETTKKVLIIPEYHRQNIYTILRWMMQHFQELRLKDNCDLSNKRLRCNEYIASLLTKNFSARIGKAFNKPSRNKITIDDIRDMFKFPGNIIAEEMYNSGVLRFDDNVNDMDFFAKTKFTVKGPNSHGGTNSNTISMKYRAVHPSMLGRTDVLVCGNSDPGTSGCLSPFVKMDGLYFDAQDESSDYFYNIIKEIKDKYKDTDKIYIMCECDNAKDFYNLMNKIQNFNSNEIVAECTSREDKYDIVIHNVHDMEDQTGPSTVALQKKVINDISQIIKAEDFAKELRKIVDIEDNGNNT